MKTVSPLGLAISRPSTTHLSFSWTNAESQFSISIEWYCLKIKTASGTYGASCDYQGLYPANPVQIPIDTIINTYGYAPGSFPTVKLTQKAVSTASITYTESNPLEEISIVDIIAAP
jgi:hypothetical protein